MNRSTGKLSVPSSSLSAEEVRQLRWAGWSILALIVISWTGWVSLTAIANSRGLVRTEERQNLQFERLRDDVAEIRTDVKTLLKR
ncbi:MAG: hypothetical protein KDA96_10165 [Planctomycetaceae bacterium]|nr:hypothetical protein [Planctomycetaceae bacterium]